MAVRAACLVFPAVLAAPAAATDHDAGLWSTLGVGADVAPRVRASLVVQARVRDDVSDLERIVLRPSLTFRIGPGLAATLGYDAHVIETGDDTVEHRAWQQLRWQIHPDRTSFHGRVRLEERFLRDVSGAAWRARFRAGLRHPLNEDWSLLVNDEVFVHLTSHRRGPEDGFDQNRLFVGAGRPLGGDVRLAVGYLNQWIDRDGRSDVMNHILSVTLRFDP